MAGDIRRTAVNLGMPLISINDMTLYRRKIFDIDINLAYRYIAQYMYNL